MFTESLQPLLSLLDHEHFQGCSGVDGQQPCRGHSPCPRSSCLLHQAGRGNCRESKSAGMVWKSWHRPCFSDQGTFVSSGRLCVYAASLVYPPVQAYNDPRSGRVLWGCEQRLGIHDMGNLDSWSRSGCRRRITVVSPVHSMSSAEKTC